MALPRMPPTTVKYRTAFIGGGNMARSLIGGLVRGGMAPSDIVAAEPNEALRAALADDFGITVEADNIAAAAGARTLVLAVKPQVMRSVCEALAQNVRHHSPLVISIAAGTRIDQIECWLGGHVAIVRAMPNTPALIGAGAAGLCANTRVTATQRSEAERILGAAGLTVWIEREALMDVVTALSGSGPAYFFLLIEALEDAAVSLGLPCETARALAIQTCFGAGCMLRESGEAPSRLRERVTSPGGTTQAALESFAADDLHGIVSRAITAATRRGGELSSAIARD